MVINFSFLRSFNLENFHRFHRWSELIGNGCWRWGGISACSMILCFCVVENFDGKGWINVNRKKSIENSLKNTNLIIIRSTVDGFKVARYRISYIIFGDFGVRKIVTSFWKCKIHRHAVIDSVDMEFVTQKNCQGF